MFFRAGYLSILERQVEEKIHDFLVKFQAHIRGYLGRKLREKLELQHAAAHVIQRNVFQADIINNWPWWKLFQKASCLACCKHACAYSYTCICWYHTHIHVSVGARKYCCFYMLVHVHVHWGLFVRLLPFETTFLFSCFQVKPLLQVWKAEKEVKEKDVR